MADLTTGLDGLLVLITVVKVALAASLFVGSGRKERVTRRTVR